MEFAKSGREAGLAKRFAAKLFTMKLFAVKPFAMKMDEAEMFAGRGRTI